nr:Scr1 family TA system antitoxin-like transcriptional regulator [Micromonospora sp. DSM 115978]
MRDLLELYQVSDTDRREALLELVRLSSEQGWWQSYGHVVPDWLDAYIGFEGEASRIQTYESVLVPGLLQTEQYARALVRSCDRDVCETDVDRMVALRTERQHRVDGEQRPEYWAVIDES